MELEAEGGVVIKGKKRLEKNKPAMQSSFRLVESARWAFQVMWATHPGFVLGLGLMTLVRGSLPAALALMIRRLTNLALDVANHQVGDLAALLPWLGVTLLITVAEAVSGTFHRFLIDRIADDIDLSITSKILDHAARLDVSLFEDSRFQDIIYRAQHNSARHFSQFLADSLAIATQLMQVISLVVVLVVVEPLVIVVVIPLSLSHLWVKWRLSKEHYQKEWNRATKRRWSNYFVSLLTTQRTMPEVKLLGLAPILISRFRSLMIEFRDQNRKLSLKSFTMDSVFALLTTVSFYLMLARVFQRFLQGALRAGDVVIFGTVGLRLRGLVENLVWSINKVLEDALYISNLQAFFRLQPRIQPTSGLSPTSSRGEIEFRNVSFAYPGTETRILSDVSFHVGPGETVAVVGNNGAGKTTLVKLIARFYDPDAGAVFYDGLNLRELSLGYLHRQIAFVFQGFGHYEATAMENIAYGDWKRLLQDRPAVERISHYTGIHQLIERMPQGYDTLLGRRFGEYDLSQGQWQQVAIARAFARDAPILILDEPTSHLDVMTEYDLFNRSRELARGRTTILISHRFSTVKMADRILVLDQGQIVEAGTHSELVARQGTYAKLYDVHRRQMDQSLDGG